MSVHEGIRFLGRIVFVRDDLAMIQAYDRLIRAQFDPNGLCVFTEEESSPINQRLLTAHQGKLVWAIEDDKHKVVTLRIGNKNIPWSDKRGGPKFELGERLYGYASGQRDGLPDERFAEIFCLDENGKFQRWPLRTHSIIGSGRLESSCWFADEEGNVYIFNHEPQTVQIHLLQLSYCKHKLMELLAEDGTWRSWSDVLPEFKK